MNKRFSVNVRLTETEYQALEMIASHEVTSTSGAVRWLIHAELGRRGVPVGLVNFYKYLPDPVPAEVAK